MFFNKFLSVALTLSATTFVFSQTEIPVQINSINGISAFDQNNNPKWTNSVTPFQFNNNSDLRPNPNNSQTSIFDFEIEFQVLQGFNVGFVKIYDLNNNLLGSFYLPQTTFPPGIYTVNLVDLGAMFVSPNNGYPNFKIWIYGTYIASPFLDPPPNADLRYFDVNIFVDPVEDLHFASNSPLVLNSNNEYELSLSWTASPDPIIDANAPDVVIDKYRHFLINNEVEQTPAPTTTETITFPPALQGDKKVNDFSVIAEDNYGNKSTSYNKCYVYDSWKKTASGTTPQLTTNLTPSPNGDLIFTGWFDVNGSMTVNAKKLLISENSKISFVGGNSQLEFISGSFENNSQISANGGSVTLKSSQNINLNNLSLLSENGILTLDANLTLSNGNYLSILDNVVVKAGHTITVANGSSVKINANSTVTYENGASIVLQNGAVLEIDGIVNVSTFQSPNLIMQNGSKTKNF